MTEPPLPPQSAPSRPEGVAARLAVGGVEVARYVDSSAVTDPRLSPRPYLHPVRTLGGTVVTDCRPDDHPWHLGLSVAVQDVGGVNLWGGPTYGRGQSYVWRDDHGVQRRHAWQVREADRCVEELGWYAPDGRCLLVESRSLQAASCDVVGTPAWVLSIDIRLRNVSGAPVALGSPATNGLVGAGYGGLFWRLPSVTSTAQVFTATASGEAAVHGAVSPWLAWVADGPHGSRSEPASPGSTSRAELGQIDDDPAPPRAFTVALAAGAADEGGRTDPWFVRMESYPGMCSALAFEQPALLAVDGVLPRHFDALIADGALDPPSVAAWAHHRSGQR